MNSTSRIKSKALELGFSKVGIARADHLLEEGQRLLTWLHRGHHATMSWLSRESEKRIDPRHVLSNAKSVVSVAMNYYTPHQHTQSRDVGKISRYAWGDDYHEMITQRLQALGEFIETEFPEVKSKHYVDTGPVMEKAWAQRAGLGWVGKHTNVITKEFGSWVFLGEIILDVELEYDAPGLDFCGSCRACIDACPTQAIVEEYVLDSSKCISYLTIEHRDTIPAELASQFDNWIYGCDICQDVCPWNKFQQSTLEKEFQPRPDTLAPNLAELVEMSSQEFSRRFARSPIKRTKHAGLTRNARCASECSTLETK